MLRNPAPQSFEALSTLGDSPFAAIAASTAQTVASANRGVAVRVKPKRTFTVAFLDWFPGSVSAGNYDIGIYNGAGTTKLWSKGSTVWPTASVAVAETVTGVTLQSGTEYRIILSGSDATANFRGFGILAPQAYLVDGTALANDVASAVPLGSTITLGTASIRIPLVCIREA